VDAEAMGWHSPDNEWGSVTAAWEEWSYVDRDQRTWTAQTLAWAQERYDDEWQKIKHSPGNPDGPEPIDLFYDRLDGLMPHEHEWMTLAATIRDAVSAYEVYLSKAFDEVLDQHQLARQDPLRTAPWRYLNSFGRRMLGVDAKPPGVTRVLELRNILTHQRGELRHERDRQQHGRSDGLLGYVAVLTPEQTIGHLDELSAAVHAVEPLAWAYSWGGLRIPMLEERAASRSEA
jgi:hypothetical protein